LVFTRDHVKRRGVGNLPVRTRCHIWHVTQRASASRLPFSASAASAGATNIGNSRQSRNSCNPSSFTWADRCTLWRCLPIGIAEALSGGRQGRWNNCAIASCHVPKVTVAMSGSGQTEKNSV
jgi:hypothetical protein